MSQKGGCTRDLELKSGKYVRVTTTVMGGRIVDVYIRGDFFCYPEDAVERLEESLRGASVDDVERIFHEIMDDADIVGMEKEELLGILVRSTKCV